MEQVESFDVLIVGSGPAGTSTALHLLQQSDSWATRMAIVDKAIHPREKLCGGGITHMGRNILSRLGLSLEVPNFVVREAKIVYGEYSFSLKGNPVFTVVRRDEFDHWLVQKVEEKDVAVRQGETVLSVATHDDYVEVKTSKSVIRAKVLVAADGSRSTIRSKLKWDDESRVARLLEILTPEDPREQVGFRESQAVFDFTPTDDGLQGYYWDFPSYVSGEAFMNRGVFDSRARPERPKVDLVGELRESLAERERNLDDYKLKGHPIRWFDKNGKYAIPRVLLAGDAAGADPLVGEGISFALAYGEVAAATIVDAFDRQDFNLADYGQRIMDHNVLWQLPTRTRLARMAYRWGKYRLIATIGWRIVGFVSRFSRWRDPEHNPVEAPRIVYDS